MSINHNWNAIFQKVVMIWHTTNISIIVCIKYMISCLLAGGDPLEQLVRHFLIEKGPRGVKIKGCQNEPYFGEQFRNPLYKSTGWLAKNCLSLVLVQLKGIIHTEIIILSSFTHSHVIPNLTCYYEDARKFLRSQTWSGRSISEYKVGVNRTSSLKKSVWKLSSG